MDRDPEKVSSTSSSDNNSLIFEPIQSTRVQSNVSRGPTPSSGSLHHTLSHNGYSCDANVPAPSDEVDEKDPFEVGWNNGDADPLNPRSLGKLRKWFIVIIISFASFCVTAASSIYTSTYAQMEAEFGNSRIVSTLGLSLFVLGLSQGPMFMSPLSEFYGRRPIYLVAWATYIIWIIPQARANNIGTMLVARFLDGFSGSAFLAVSGGTVGDLFSRDEIQAPMLLFSLAPFVGPSLGPLFGGFINYNTNWRWTYYFLLIWGFVLYLAIIFYVPETYHPIVLRTKARKMRKETGDERWKSPSERAEKSVVSAIGRSLLRPFQLLIFEPMCLNLCLLSAILLGTLYLFFGAFPLVFRNVYGFNLWQSGLTFMGILAGMIMAAFLDPVWNRVRGRLNRQLAEETGVEGGSEPEFRLPPAIVGAVITPIGIFMFGWSCFPWVHWIVPIIGSAIFGAGTLLVFSGIFTFLVDAYPQSAASALAANAFVRCSFAVNLNHFRLLRVVGRGAFGKVRIVERKDTNLSFALKYIRKDEVVRSESVRNIIRERRMLEYVNHPFICNLRYSFQDIEYMYLVVDLMTGGDLRFHISRKTFTEEAVRFWIAELGCALKYVHQQNIIHRDVKPDNVLLDADGHVHLTDFNVASDVVPGRALTSKSGTLAYLAPEVYAGKGYDIRADWWSLGVLFYECIYNKRPFEGGSEGSLSQQIQAANPKYPVTQPPVSLSCLYSIGSALDPNRDTRMGSTWESFIHNEFFKCFDFELLEQKRIEPIFVPSSEKTNFDATYDLEELLLEEAPLEARARRQKPRERLKEDATDKEIREDELYRMIETDFKPFDYTVAAYKKITEAAINTPATNNNNDNGSNNNEVHHETDNGPQAITTNEATPMPAQNGVYQHSPLNPSISNESRQGRPARPAPPPPTSQHYQNDFRARHVPIVAGQRMTSPSGGVQVTLDGGGSWSELARQDATLPTDANNVGEGKAETSGGMFGFLKSKKGRTNSPKPKERGVLGKEGARVVIG